MKDSYRRRRMKDIVKSGSRREMERRMRRDERMNETLGREELREE